MSSTGKPSWILRIRDSNSVLPEADWPVRDLTIIEGKVLSWQVINQGATSMCAGPQIGWTLQEIAEWLAYDGTGTHPEQFHEAYVPAPEGNDWVWWTNLTVGQLESHQEWALLRSRASEIVMFTGFESGLAALDLSPERAAKLAHGANFVIEAKDGQIRVIVRSTEEAPTYDGGPLLHAVISRRISEPQLADLSTLVDLCRTRFETRRKRLIEIIKEVHDNPALADAIQDLTRGA